MIALALGVLALAFASDAGEVPPEIPAPLVALARWVARNRDGVPSLSKAELRRVVTTIATGDPVARNGQAHLPFDGSMHVVKGNQAHFLVECDGWLAEIEPWGERCIERGVLHEEGDEDFQESAGTLEARMLQYSEESDARIELLPQGDPDAPPPGMKLFGRALYPILDPYGTYEAVEIRIWRPAHDGG
jgi:hypothetical protein